MAKTNKKASRVEEFTKMSREDIKEVVDVAIKQNPLVFKRLAEI